MRGSSPETVMYAQLLALGPFFMQCRKYYIQCIFVQKSRGNLILSWSMHIFLIFRFIRCHLSYSFFIFLDLNPNRFLIKTQTPHAKWLGKLTLKKANTLTRNVWMYTNLHRSFLIFRRTRADVHFPFWVSCPFGVMYWIICLIWGKCMLFHLHCFRSIQ